MRRRELVGLRDEKASLSIWAEDRVGGCPLCCPVGPYKHAPGSDLEIRLARVLYPRPPSLPAMSAPSGITLGDDLVRSFNASISGQQTARFIFAVIRNGRPVQIHPHN
jgi:hypothetical protein